VIGTVLRQGYKLGDQILRHAMVGVGDPVADGDHEPDATGEGEETGPVGSGDNAGTSGD
jgi:molecular chaperone GrpE